MASPSEVVDPCLCNICGKRLSSPANLKRHMQRKKPCYLDRKSETENSGAGGYVYIMSTTPGSKMKSGKKYRCKIGKSKNHPEERRKQLQTGNHRDLHLVAYVRCEGYDELERELHRLMDSQHIRREWFWLTLRRIDRMIEELKMSDQRDSDIAALTERFAGMMRGA